MVIGLGNFGRRWSVLVGESWKAEKLAGNRGARKAGIQILLGNVNGESDG